MRSAPTRCRLRSRWPVPQPGRPPRHRSTRAPEAGASASLGRPTARASSPTEYSRSRPAIAARLDRFAPLRGRASLHRLRVGNPLAHGGVTADRHGVVVDVDPVADGGLDRVVIDECRAHRPPVVHEDRGRRLGRRERRHRRRRGRGGASLPPVRRTLGRRIRPGNAGRTERTAQLGQRP